MIAALIGNLACLVHHKQRRCSFHFLCLRKLHKPGNDAEPFTVPVVHLPLSSSDLNGDPGTALSQVPAKLS